MAAVMKTLQLLPVPVSHGVALSSDTASGYADSDSAE